MSGINLLRIKRVSKYNKKGYNAMIKTQNKWVFLVTLIMFALLIPGFQQQLEAGCGTTWKNGNVTADVFHRGVVFANGYFLSVGDKGKVYKSSDGKNWYSKKSGLSLSDHMFGVAYGNNYYVAALRDGRVARIHKDDLSAGKNWSIVYNLNDTEDMAGAAFGNGTFVVLGQYGTVLSSTNNGGSWTKKRTSFKLRTIEYGAGRFVAGTGGADTGGGERTKILVSTDGQSWSEVETLPINIRDIVFSGTKWLAVGYHVYLCQSTDPAAEPWTRSLRQTIPEGASNPVDQFYGGWADNAMGMYVVAGEHGLLYTSSNGINWTKQTTGTKRFIVPIEYGNGVVAALGNGGPRTPNSIYLYSTHYSECGGGTGPGSITVSSPNGGEMWEVGSSQDVNWYSSGSVGNVKLEYSVDNGASWILFDGVAKNDGNRPWVVPDEDSDQCLVKVTSVNSPSIYDTSNAPFTIYGGTPATITVTEPNGGEAWTSGTGHLINWTYTGNVSRVNLEYSTDNGVTWKSIESDRSNTGSKYWTIPDDASDEAKVRVTSTSNSTVFDESDEVFTIGDPYQTPTINVTTPNGGEDWEAGTTQVIQWTNTGTLDVVEIDYTTDNGTTWKQITDYTGNDGTYTWTIPEDPSTRCRVRITDQSDRSSASDTSSSPFTITSAIPAELALNRAEFNFAYALGGNVPGTQPMTLSNAGGKPLNWTSEGDQTWLTVDPTAGFGSAVVNIGIEPSALTQGEYTGIVTIDDPDAVNSPQTAQVNLKVIDPSQDQPPIGEMSYPVDGIVVNGSVPITGWALDDIHLVSVKIYYNQASELGNALFVEGARADIEISYPDHPANFRAGWGYMMLTNSLPDGEYAIYAVATDNAGKTTTFGPRTITIDNANAVTPFGAIDFPAPGGEASGSRYVNWGWALTPLPSMIPIDGSTINIFVDSQLLSTVDQYNIESPGIAGLFPGLMNSGGPMAFYYLDTTAYENGVHQIAWTVTDDAGNAAGIGSRFFNIRNSLGGASQASRAAARGVAQGRKLSLVQRNNTNPLRVKNGYRMGIDAPVVVPDEKGAIYVQSREMERIQLRPGNGAKFTTGYMVVGDKYRHLPVGSTLNPDTGTFSWQHGLGFVGDYHLVLISVDAFGHQTKTDIYVTIHHK